MDSLYISDYYNAIWNPNVRLYLEVKIVPRSSRISSFLLSLFCNTIVSRIGSYNINALQRNFHNNYFGVKLLNFPTVWYLNSLKY